MATEARYTRTAALIGDGGVKKLRSSKVLVIGLGGVGGAAFEALVRSGVGELVAVDGDVFEPTNLNRQILCTERTLGQNKAEIAKARAKEIDGSIKVTAVAAYADESNIDALTDGIDLCIDAIDDVKNKVRLIVACKAKNVDIISAMGAGNRTDCSFAVTDIYKTAGDPFARVMRRELKKAGISSLETVCAAKPPAVTSPAAPASIASPPIAMGAMLAGRALERLLEK